MMRKALFALLVLAVLVGCSGQNAPAPTSTPVSTPTATLTPTAAPSSITLTDGLKRTVTLRAPAQRVVSLAPSNTEILFAVGAGAQVVGRDEASDYPAEASNLPTVGGWSGFSREAIVALEPDLVLAAEITPPELVAELEGLGLTVYLLPNPHTLEEMYANLETVARLTGHEAEAQTLVARLQERVAAVDAQVTGIETRPRVYYELDATEPAKPWTAGPGSFVDLLIARAGGINVAGDLTGEWVQIGLEELLVRDPDIILLGDALYGETPEKVAARPGWDALRAVRNGQVFPFDDTLISRPGPRLVDALEALFQILHSQATP